jgi:Fe-Mn family superoxide dismutase
LNTQLEGSERDLPTLIKTLSGPNFNLAAQIYNHTFFWESMSPSGGGEPNGKVGELIVKQWGSFENFKVNFFSLLLFVHGYQS